ncbi:MAG: hypothetical protein GKC05_04515 [Methanomicrobiales archaeon]|nr:hypothetical protein [Methanomicrobiales archaeon]
MTAPASASPGSRMTVSATVKNSGSTYASYSDTFLYLSDDQVPDPGDTFLGKVYTPLLTAGSSRTVSTTVTVPSDTRPGTYYLVAVADGARRIAEEDEQNNAGFRSLGVQAGLPPTQPVTPVATLTPVPTTPPPSGTAQPDLVVTGVTGPAAATPGSRVTVSASVRNAGDATASYSYTSFYLSADPTVDAADSYLGRTYTSSLTAGSSRTVSAFVTIPLGTGGGSMYLCALADGTARVVEKDEDNNTGSGSLTIQGSTQPTPSSTLTPVPTTPPPSGTAQPDLVVTGVSAPSSASSGERIALVSTVQNTGSVSASYSYTYFYLSQDTTIDTGDTYLGRIYTSSLAPGASKTVSYSITLPSGTPAGSYHLCVMADGTARVGESHEDNNVASAGITVTGLPLPDLVAVSVTGPATSSPGGIISVQATVRNGGTAPSGETRAGIYLSGDSSITTGDILLGSVSLPGLATGSTTTLSGYVMIPVGVTPASYYLGIIADDTAVVEELDEGNNAACSSGTIAISPGPAGTIEDKVEQAIIRYTNLERINAGLTPFSENPQLSSIARAHSLDMKVRDYFSHYNPDGLDPFERMIAGGYTYWCAAENIACTSYFTQSDVPDEVGRYFVQDMWMKSPGHRENILDTCVTEIGVGVVYESDRSSSPYGFIAAQNFGKPR